MRGYETRVVAIDGKITGCYSTDGAIIGNSGAGYTTTWGRGTAGDSGLDISVGGYLSLREASHFDNDVLLPSNCGIPLLLAITEDLLLALTASVIGFARFWGVGQCGH
jgi:hypothetical protein